MHERKFAGLFDNVWYDPACLPTFPIRGDDNSYELTGRNDYEVVIKTYNPNRDDFDYNLLYNISLDIKKRSLSGGAEWSFHPISQGSRVVAFRIPPLASFIYETRLKAEDMPKPKQSDPFDFSSLGKS